MCMLLAYDTKAPHGANDILSALFSHGNEHPHGWGVSYLPAGDESRRVTVREPKNAAVSERAQAILREPIETAHLIGHIRKASVGSLDIENCHPFVREDAAGNTWALAHNGTLFEPRAVAAYYGGRRGTTDSEAILPYLVEAANVARAQGADDDALVGALDHAIAQISAGNKLNLVFSDGTRTYAYTNDANRTLWHVRLDDGWAFATAPLDGRSWEPMPLCQLVAVCDGEPVYEGRPNSGVFAMGQVEYLNMIQALSA